MGNKYIIRNCPAFVLMRTATSGTYITICGIAKGHVECQDCTDCLMKCIKSILDYFKCYINNDNSANLSKMNEIIDRTVQLLDIEDAEDEK